MDLQIHPGKAESRPMMHRFKTNGFSGMRKAAPATGRIIGITQGNPEAAAEAADNFVRQAKIAIGERGRFNAALCGGGTARMIYELLSGPALAGQVEWEKTHIYLVNELCGPVYDSKCHFRMLLKMLLTHVPIPLAQVHPIPRYMSSARAAVFYNQGMQQLFDDTGLDLIFLQWGEYGHNCFFPHEVPVVQKTHAWVAELYYPGRDLHAVTLTMRTVYRSRKAVFLIHQHHGMKYS